jgi:hypothetical protein
MSEVVALCERCLTEPAKVEARFSNEGGFTIEIALGVECVANLPDLTNAR